MSAIEWCTKTWNPVLGCSNVSEGCRHCWARERVMARQSRFEAKRSPALPVYQGLVAPKENSQPGDRYRWTGEVRLVRERLTQPMSWRKPQTVFVASQADLFHENRLHTEIAAVFEAMAACPQHTFLCSPRDHSKPSIGLLGLTETALEAIFPNDSREWRLNHCLKAAAGHIGITTKTRDMDHWPLPNVWLGVSVENQEAASRRLPRLLSIPAARHFVSYEPALGALDLTRYLPDIDWVIAGAESGARARSAPLDWFRSVRDQCVGANVPFFLKQAEIDRKLRKGCPALDGVVWAQIPSVAP